MAPPWCRGDSSALSPFHMGQEAAPGSPIAKQVQGAAGSRGPTANVAQPPDLLLTFSRGASSEGRAVCTPVTIPPGRRGYDPAENLPAPGPLPAGAQPSPAVVGRRTTERDKEDTELPSGFRRAGLSQDRAGARLGVPLQSHAGDHGGSDRAQGGPGLCGGGCGARLGVSLFFILIFF